MNRDRQGADKRRHRRAYPHADAWRFCVDNHAWDFRGAGAHACRIDTHGAGWQPTADAFVVRPSGARAGTARQPLAGAPCFGRRAPSRRDCNAARWRSWAIFVSWIGILRRLAALHRSSQFEISRGRSVIPVPDHRRDGIHLSRLRGTQFIHSSRRSGRVAGALHLPNPQPAAA
jgi:hypothetical protein